jgi:HEAT repeat protein
VNLLAKMITNPQTRVSSSLAHYMTLHDSPNVADHLLQIARNTSYPTEVRSSAISWLGREVSRKAGDDLNALANDPDSQIQRQAVSAMSRRPDDEAIPALIRIAKEHPNAAVRSDAIRLLGQKKDPRVVDFFEQLLKKK